MKKVIKYKIIISSYDDIKNPYYGGGGAIAVHEVFKRLTKNFQVMVITGKYPGSRDEIKDRIFYKRIGLNIFGPKIGQLIFQFLLPLYAKIEKYDIWVESFTPPFSTACLPLFTKKPVVGLVHMLSAEDMFRKYKLPLKSLQNLGLKVYRNFIVLSEMTKTEIKKNNSKARFLKVSNGVNLPVSLPEYRKREKQYILFIGRIEVNQKGLDLLLEAFNLVKDKINYRLKIAGGGLEKEIKKLNQIINYYKLSDRVEYVGKVNGLKKEDFFKKAVFAVIPSRFETFPLTALEIFSYGLPLVTFNIPGLNWIPNGYALKASNFSPQSLSQIIIKLSKDSKLKNELSQRSFSMAKRYCWDEVSVKYGNFITQVLITNNGKGVNYG
jgi:phosphatidyl-myo-inositol alpha-mannosyltransferase